jgi:ATPases involved in chromosome partitioning
LREGIEDAQAEILDLNARSTRFQALKREVDTNAQLYDGLLQRLKEVDISAGVANNNISIVDRAEIPRAAISPNMKQNLLIALVLGLIAGGGLAFLFEMLDDTIKSTADLEKITDRPVLGVTPIVADDEGTDTEVALMSYLQPTSGLAESLRSMRTALSLSSSEGAPKVLHFTSTAASEGKTTTAINTAINFAQTGGRVLIIDGDLRNPSLHKIFNKPNDAGLTNYLTGESDPGRVTQTTGIDNLYLMSSGPIPPNPAELCTVPKLQA